MSFFAKATGRPQATLMMLSQRWGIRTVYGPPKDPEVIVFHGPRDERWKRICRGVYELVEDGQ